MLSICHDAMTPVSSRSSSRAAENAYALREIRRRQIEQSRNSNAWKPSILGGYIIIVASVLFFVVGIYATLLSAFWNNTGIWILDVLARDTHYKYLALLLIPTGAYFVIANWVGWQYYRNS
ncbi:hypothetical protein K474DRAFT_639738 [Panus rudis PR-1116 ss-1]|nr:hypothetical protein K474DRAFT_639738 [Panus rudis PR-1116 ss-1]